jgi:hypothetical protein
MACYVKIARSCDVKSSEVLDTQWCHSIMMSFNGDLGIAASIEPTEQEVTTDFDGQSAACDYADLYVIT